MLIVCPNCATSYRVESSSLGAAGRSVRCVRCRNVWFVRDPAALAAIAGTDRTEMSALAASVSEDIVVTTSSAEDMPPETAPDAEQVPPAPSIDPYAPPVEPDAQLPIAEAAPTPAAAEWLEHDSLPKADEPVTIADAPALTPMEQSASLPADARLGEDIESFAARLTPRKRRPRRSLPGLPIAILALLALNAALIAWRADVVRVAPQTASLYAALGMPVNLRGLSFSHVMTATETHEGVQVLVVEGTIASASTRVVEVPRLRFSVRNGGGQEVYAWTALPTRSILAPGETLAFRSRLASPPPDGRDVLVRFFNRRDLVAGVQ
jgi:predicted Zn finger-like uncharacterized protein